MRPSLRYPLLLILTLISLAKPLKAADKRGSSTKASDRLMGPVDSSAFRTRQQASKLLAMTQAGYYSTQIGIDVRLNATCNSSLVVQCPIPNTAPSVVQTIPPQSTTVGQVFSFSIAGGTFTDTETPDALTISVSGLPAGLTYTNGLISGTASTTGTSTITVTATDPGSLSASTTFTLTVSASTTQPTGPATLTITSFNCFSTNGALSSVNFVVGYSDGTFIPTLPDLFLNGITITGQLGMQYSLSFDANQSEQPIADQASRQVYFVWNYRQACTSGSVTPPAPTKPVAPMLPNQTATVGTFFSYVIPPFTGTAPITYSATGLPNGLNFDANSRTISGSPNTVQTPTVTISASNVAGQSTGQFTIAVSASAVTPTGPATLTITSFTCFSTNGALSRVDFVVGYSNGTFTPVLADLFINGITTSGQLGVPYTFGFDANASALPIQDQATRSTYFVWDYRQACAAPVLPPAPTGPATLTITSFTCITINSVLTGVDFKVTYNDGAIAPAVPDLFINGITITGQLGVKYSLSFDANQNIIVVADQASRKEYFTWNFRQACATRPNAQRLSAEAAPAWQVSVLGNPIAGTWVDLRVSHARGLSLLVRVSDIAGRLVSEQTTTVFEEAQTVRAGLSTQGGIYMIQVSDGLRQQSLRVVRP